LQAADGGFTSSSYEAGMRMYGAYLWRKGILKKSLILKIFEFLP